MKSDYTYETVNTGIWIGSTISKPYQRLQFADINNDSLPDVISLISNNNLRLFINKGTDDVYGTFTRPGHWTKDRRRFDVRDYSSIQWASGIMMLDLNGDSIADMFYSTPSANKLYVRYGTGDISAPFGSKVFYMHARHQKPGGGYNNYVSDWFKTFADLDGDGDTEIIARGGSGYGHNLYVHDNKANINNDYIKQITDGMGVATNIYYKKHTVSQFGTKEYPRPVSDDDINLDEEPDAFKVRGSKYLVGRIEQSNGVGGYNRTFYRYGNYYGHRYGLSIGFDKIETKSFALSADEEKDEGNLNVTHFSLNYKDHTAGMPITAVDWVAHEHIFQKLNNDDELENLNIDWFPVSYNKPSYETILFDKYNVPAGVANIWDQNASTNYRYQVKTTQNVTVNYHLVSEDENVGDTYRGGEQSVKIDEFETDVWGNNTYARSIITNDKDDVFLTETHNEYQYDDETQWYLGKLSKATVTKESTLSGVTQPSITRSSEWSYNSATHSQAPGAVHIETINPGDVNYEVVKTYTYNKSGLKQCVTTDASHVTAVTSCTHYGNEGVNTDSDTENNFRYVSHTVNPLGHRSTNTNYHPVHGGIGRVTDANGNWSESEYDNLGRLVRKKDKLGNTTDIAMEFCNGACPDEPRAKYRIHTTGTGAPDSWEYYDMLNRVVRNVSVNFNGEEIHSKVEYDGLGRKIKEYEPFTLTNQGAAKFSHTTNFDAMSRPTRMEAANGAVKTVEYKRYGIKETTTYDTASSETADLTKLGLDDGETRDKVYETQVYADGSTEWVKENEDTNYTISYLYDSMGNMTRMTDAAGNTTQIWYDNAGNKTRMSDPDKGSWRYVYDGLGRLLVQKDALGNNTCMKYDVVGRMTHRWNTCYDDEDYSDVRDYARNNFQNLDIADANAIWEYDDTVNKGMLAKVTAHDYGHTYTKEFTYDEHVRVVDVTENQQGKTYVTSTAYYPEGSIHAGKVAKVTYPRYDNSFKRFSVQNNYNSLGFLKSIQQVTGTNSLGKIYWKLNSVNERGQPTSEFFSEESAQSNTYAFTQGKQYSNSTSLMTQMTVQRSDINWADPSANTILKLNYHIDEQGNIRQREEKGYNHHLTETYKFDYHQRLTEVTYNNDNVNGFVKQKDSVDYDILGNIIKKSDVGDYRYGDDCTTGAKGPHAVCQTVSESGVVSSYEYDANGSMIKRNGLEIRYSAFGKPEYLEGKDNTETRFYYGPDQTRVARVDKTAKGLRRTSYASGGAYEYIDKGAEGVEERIAVGGFLSITYEAGDDEVTEEHYLIKDHLGSVSTIVNKDGYVTERMSFDAWGKRRTYVSWKALSIQQEQVYAQFERPVSTDAEFFLDNEVSSDSRQITTRGFTGHEMVDTVGLIHMNGRMYDSTLGRFISADPHIQSPTSTGSLNRYSYVMNNPVSYTDPSGYFFKKLFKGLKKLVNKVVSAWKSSWRSVGNFFSKIGRELKRALNHEVFGSLIRIAAIIGCGMTGIGAIACAGLVSGGATFIATGDLGMAIQAGVMAAVQAGMSAGIGSHFDGLASAGTVMTEIGRATAHGALGAVMAVARGGKASAGFLSGFISTSVSKFTPGGNVGARDGVFNMVDVKNIFRNAMIGGVVSETTGGKFGNGAMTGAFEYMFNEMASMPRALQFSMSNEESMLRGAVEQGYGLDPDKLPEQVFEITAEAGVTALMYHPGGRVTVVGGKLVAQGVKELATSPRVISGAKAICIGCAVNVGADAGYKGGGQIIRDLNVSTVVRSNTVPPNTIITKFD